MTRRLIILSLIKPVAISLLIAIAQKAIAQSGETFLPLPSQAQPRELPKEGYILQRAGKSGYVVSAGFVQACFVVTSTGVVVIDAPPALADKLPAAIKSVTDKPVTHVILTHDHFDHIGAVTVFHGAKLVAHAETADLLRRYPDPKRPIPSITFAGDSLAFKVGGIEFKLIYPGPNHETGNIIVYVPEDKLAILTDIIIPGWAPFRGWGNADHIPGLFKAFGALLALDFDTFVGGHIYRTGTRADVKDSRDYLVDLCKDTKTAMATIAFQPTSYSGNVWAAQKVWFDQIADQVTPRLIAKWKDKLAGVDIFTHDNVVATMVSLTTDATVISDHELLK